MNRFDELQQYRNWQAFDKRRLYYYGSKNVKIEFQPIPHQTAQFASDANAPA